MPQTQGPGGTSHTLERATLAPHFSAPPPSSSHTAAAVTTLPPRPVSVDTTFTPPSDADGLVYDDSVSARKWASFFFLARTPHTAPPSVSSLVFYFDILQPLEPPIRTPPPLNARRRIMPRVYPPIDGKSTNAHLPPSIIESVAGFSAGIVSTLAVHPFDVVKTRLQVDQASQSTVGGSWRVVKSIASSEGVWTGFYRGLTPNIVGNSVSWGLYFMWYGNIKETLHHIRQRSEPGAQLKSIDYFMASGLSGILTAVFTNPIWVIKTRMLSSGKGSPGAYRNIAHGAKDIWASEGLRGFYRGLLPSLFGVSHGAIQFMAYEQLKIWRTKQLRGIGQEGSGPRPPEADEALDSRSEGTAQPPIAAGRGVELSNFDFLTLSAISKIFAGSITYPYQVVRSRLQTYNAQSQYQGALDLMRQLYLKEGIWGFYKGLGPNIVRVLPSTCVTFVVYENMKIYLGRQYGDLPPPDEEA